MYKRINVCLYFIMPTPLHNHCYLLSYRKSLLSVSPLAVANLPLVTAMPGTCESTSTQSLASAPVSYTHLDVYKRQII